MNEKPNSKIDGMVAATIVAALLLLVQYVLSGGPAAALVVRNHLTLTACRTVYSPVLYATDKSDAAGSWLKWWQDMSVPAE